MGRFIWNEWARFVSISACTYLVWAAIWGLFFRKFFFDFVDHGVDIHPILDGFHNDNVTGQPLQIPVPIPNPKFDAIETVITKIPLIQIFCLISALALLTIELPLPFVKGTWAHRSLTLRAVWLVIQSTFAVLFYQGTNAFIWGLIAAFAYTRAEMAGEMIVGKNAAAGAGGRRGGDLPRGAARA